MSPEVLRLQPKVTEVRIVSKEYEVYFLNEFNITVFMGMCFELNHSMVPVFLCICQNPGRSGSSYHRVFYLKILLSLSLGKIILNLTLYGRNSALDLPFKINFIIFMAVV